MSVSLPPDSGDGVAGETDHRGEDQEGNPGAQPIMSDEALYAIEVKEQDRWLPIANVARIMKTALPENAKISKEAKLAMQECVSEFISFITSEASEKCQQEKRKTVNGEDILFAMTSLGFENYSEALKIYLTRYRMTNTSKSESNPSKGTGGDDLASGEVASGTPPGPDGTHPAAEDESPIPKVETAHPDGGSAPEAFSTGDEAAFNGSYAS